jgi:adenosylmethionine-8-amino-7-oxononanoate aminotransferase
VSDLRERTIAIDKARVWHPYTEMSRYREEVEPLVVVRAKGSRLYDADGRRYIDGNASWWTSTLGHNHPRLVAALVKQAEQLCHTSLAGIAHPAASDLAEAICAAAPSGLEHVFYSDNGSTAVEVGMKLALQYWAQNGHPERCAFIALDNAFHGETLGVTALGGVDVFRAPFQKVLLECLRVPTPAGEGNLDRSLESLRQVFTQHGDRIAAVVVESMIQGAAGMQIYDPEFLRQARSLCTEHDVFLICDEVFSGYGRTGPMWACEHADVVPDILCTAKGFSGGMLPMAATLTTDRIFQGFLGSPERAFYYGHTFCGNPLGASVAIEVLRVFEDESILAASVPKAERIARTFRDMELLAGVTRSRSIGMVGAIDLEGGEGYLADIGWRVYERARERGAYLRPLGNVVYITPSLNISDEDLDELLEIVRESVSEILALS